MTNVRYTGHERRTVEIQRGGSVIAELDVVRFCQIDGALHDTAHRAMELHGVWIPVPDKSFARGMVPRNSRSY